MIYYKAQEKPITIEELQDLYNNDPDEQAGNNFNNINTSFNFEADGSDTLSSDSIYFTPKASLVTKDWDEETIYSEPWDDTLIQDLHSNIYDQGISNASASPKTDLSPSAPLAAELPSAPPLEYLAPAPSQEDLPLPSAPPAEGITEIEKAAIEILDRVLDGDSAYDTLSDDTISDTSSEHSLESGCSIPTTPSILSPSDQNQGIKTEIGGVNITIPNHFFAQDTEDTSSLSNFSENDDEWDDEEGNKWSEQAIEDVAKRVTPESNDTNNTESVNTFDDSDATKSSTSVPIQELPKIVGYQYKEPLIPNNHYKAKPSSAEILAALVVKDELQQTLSRRRAAIEIEEDEEIDDPLKAGAINPKEKEADATYLKLSASEEARQTISRNKSAIAENKALLEAKYATIAKSRLGLAYQDPDTEIGNAFTSEFKPKNNEQVIDNDDTALTLPPPPTEAELALMNESMLPNSNDIDTTTPQGQSSYSENYNQTSSSSSEYDTDAEIRSYENVPIKPRNKRYIKKKGTRYSYRDIDQGLANLHGDAELSDVESEQWDNEWSKTAENSDSDIEGYDTVYTSSSSDDSDNSSDEDDLPLPPPPTTEELAELTKESELDTPMKSDLIAVELVSEEEQKANASSTNSANINNSSQEVSEDEEDTSNSFDTDETEMSSAALTASINGADAQVSNISQEDLLKKAAMAAVSHNQAREARKISSKQIRHRIFAKDIVTAAVAAGDEEAGGALDDAAEQTRGYSIWSSGTLGSNKQKSKADLNGYSTKIAGGTIGLELNLENDLLLGASFGKFSSRVKYQDQGGSSDLRSSTASTSTKYDTHIFSLYGSRPVSRNMSISVIGSAGYSKGTKARSKLLSFEPHLNYRVGLPREVTLIPHIGLRYEYEKVSRHKEQIASNLSMIILKRVTKP